MGPRETVSNTSCSGGKVKAPKEVNDSLTVLKLKGFCTRVCIKGTQSRDTSTAVSSGRRHKHW